MAPLTLLGVTIHGYLVLAAVLYAIVGTTLTHLIGWPLIMLNFRQQRFEADFRFNLVRSRENSEQIASLHGEAAERERHLGRFGLLVSNWIAIMQRTKKLTFFTASYSQASVIFPYVMVSPTYFSGAMQLGGLMQTASAFNNVQNSLSYFVSAYQQIAEFQAVVTRLSGFERAIEAGRAAALMPPVIEVVAREAGPAIAIDHLAVRLPHGEPLLNAEQLALNPGDRVLVSGPSGAGKSTLFRAIAGIWPFGSGRVSVPMEAKVMLMPQRPYFPLTTLAAAITYPAKAGTFDDARLTDVLTAVGLSRLAPQLAEEAHWNRMLSVGEQQRLRSRARCSTRRTTCCSTRRRRRSTSPPRRCCTACCKSGCRAPPLFRSAIVRRSPPSTAAASPSSASRTATTCATCRWSRRPNEPPNGFMK